LEWPSEEAIDRVGGLVGKAMAQAMLSMAGQPEPTEADLREWAICIILAAREQPEVDANG
jgi:hypothetical protein